ncbi:GLPGLI family protein [Chryseobacterium gambrini]|uniref:GLPGLI family protein n=1 Tax=Chryseobacterium gambrini TaxID=373672 RepID=A0ABM8K7E9_9FLAO|nr:GLPGLI family protein [Chryseobacterium gambrini]
MKYYISAFACIFSILIKSQFSGNFTLPAEKYSAENYDKSIQNVYYQLSFVSDPRTNNKKEVICVLQLGEKFSKFGELNAIKLDSLTEKFSHQQNIGAKEMNLMSPVNTRWKPILLRDISKNIVTIQDKAKESFQYSENQPTINWKLEKETKQILGYTCNKATTEFRGRKFTAWYTKDIPINNGPYIYNGLPGLIMELEDKKEHYHFTAIALDKKPINIYLRNEDKIFKISREKYREVQKAYHDNPNFYLGDSYDSGGNVIKEKAKAKPYNPIELE